MNDKNVIPFSQNRPQDSRFAALPVSVQLTDSGLWLVDFCGQQNIVKSGVIRFRADGKLDVKTEAP